MNLATGMEAYHAHEGRHRRLLQSRGQIPSAIRLIQVSLEERATERSLPFFGIWDGDWRLRNL